MKKDKPEKITVAQANPNWPLSSTKPIAADPLGSYTGIPEDILEEPVQDADDL